MEPTLANLDALIGQGMDIVAWQGVRLALPRDWEPGAFSGDWNGGHLRIDERLEPRLVVRWLPEDSTAKLFRRQPSRAAAIDELADNYLRNLEDSYKKKRKKVEHRKVERLVPRRKLNVSPISSFEWSLEGGETVAVGFTGECPTSSRVVICELTGTDWAEVRRRGEEAFSNLRLHPESDDAVLWSAFGLRFSLPREWKLSGNSLVGGKIEQRFQREGGEHLTIQRWVANLAMGKGDLVDWAKKQLAKDLKGDFSFRMERGRCRGHEAVLAEGAKRSAHERIAYAAKRLVRSDTVFHMVCRAWHCEESNKIFVVRTVSRASEKHLADEIASRVYCHATR